MDPLDILIEKDRIRTNFLPSVRKAYSMLPPMPSPLILDVGCGTGVPTIELATLGGGHVTGLDIDGNSLELLKKKVSKAGLSNRIKVVRGSMTEINFPPGSFDIIWAEGSIAFIGFERGLREWRSFLVPQGFLVVHDEAADLEQKRALIDDCSYRLLGEFELTVDDWREKYFGPLDARLQELRSLYDGDSRTLQLIEREQREMDTYLDITGPGCSVYFVIRKERGDLIRG